MRNILFVVILSIAASSGCAGQSLGNGGGDAPLIQCADVANRKHLNILSSGKCVLSGLTDKNIIGFMQRHNFEFKELDIPETIGHFVQSFDLVVDTFQRPG